MIILIKILIISLFCNGLRKLTDEGMLLHSIYNWCEKILPDWLFMPLIGCVYCYASIWGSIIYWLLSLYGFNEPVSIEVVVLWPLVCICCVFTNGLLYGIYSKYSNFIQ